MDAISPGEARIAGLRISAELDVATFDDMFASNVRAPFYLVAAFAPAMAARGKGSIINISSMAGRSACPAVRPTGPPRPPWCP
jgi:NAD(P)-dependent dehydrogenase (short-subunit alcohol dehydrogenase family)